MSGKTAAANNNSESRSPTTAADSGYLDCSAIKTILTLRYNRSLPETLLPKLGWRDFEEREADQDLESAANKVEKLLLQEMQQSVSKEKRVAFSLSGGIDSSLVFSMLRRNLPEVDVEAISIRFSDSLDETSNAAKIAERFGVKHHIVYIENYLQELPAAISIVKLPFWDLHWYHVVKKAKSLANVLLSGDGGDELFGGYTFRYRKFLSLIKEDESTQTKIEAYLACHERDWVPEQEKVFGEKCKFSWDEIHDIIRPYFGNSLDAINQVFLADFNGKLLYNWLPLNTAFHDYFGLRAVAPILSSKLIDYAIHLPYWLKYDPVKNEGKLVLRELLKRYLDVDSNNPSEDKEYSISPVKQGFSVDTLNLWKKYGHRICDYYLSDSRIAKEAHWVNESWIKRHINKVSEYAEPRYVNKFLGLLALEVWYRLFVSKELSRTDELY